LDEKAKDADLFADYPNIDSTLKNLISKMLAIEENNRLSWWFFKKKINHHFLFFLKKKKIGKK